MPHIHLEYSNNLELEPRPLLKALNTALFESGHVSAINDIKSRAVAQEDFVVGLDEHAQHAYMHAKVSLLTGRTVEVQKQISLLLLDVLKQHVTASAVEVQLCVEILEMNKATYSKQIVSP